MNFRATLGLFYRYIKPFRRQFVLGLIALLIVDLLNALPPLLLKNFIDRIGVTREFKPFLYLGLIYTSIAVAQGLCRYLWRMLLIQASYKASEQIREDYFAKLQRLPPSFYDQHPIGDLMALATNDVEAVRYALGPGVLVLADAIFLFISLPPAMLWLSPKFTLLALAPMFLLPFIIMKAEKLVHERFQKVQAHFSKLSGFAQENIEGIRVVKAFVREWTQLTRFSNIGKEYVRLNLKLAGAQSIFEPVFLLTVTFGLASLLIFGGPDVLAGVVGIGTFVAFTRYLDNLAWPMMAFGIAVTQYQRGKTSLWRIETVLNHPEPAEPTHSAIQSTIGARVAGSPLLEARNLNFTYPGQEKPALKNVSFRIEHDQKTALVGPIGSGKSTLVRLLSGLYEVQPGMLFWNGQDVTTLPTLTRRKLLSLVPQDTFLFSESLGWNVAMGPYDAEVTHALHRAGLADETKLWGLEAHIGEKGLNLSGGQRARVTLARALHRATQFDGLLVLDDALSSVDAETESKILTSIGESHQSLLMITHRFARLWSFDQVLVLNAGVLNQSGAPSKLSHEPGLYRQLLELQQMETALS